MESSLSKKKPIVQYAHLLHEINSSKFRSEKFYETLTLAFQLQFISLLLPKYSKPYYFKNYDEKIYLSIFYYSNIGYSLQELGVQSRVILIIILLSPFLLIVLLEGIAFIFYRRYKYIAQEIRGFLTIISVCSEIGYWLFYLPFYQTIFDELIWVQESAWSIALAILSIPLPFVLCSLQKYLDLELSINNMGLGTACKNFTHTWVSMVGLIITLIIKSILIFLNSEKGTPFVIQIVLIIFQYLMIISYPGPFSNIKLSKIFLYSTSLQSFITWIISLRVYFDIEYNICGLSLIGGAFTLKMTKNFMKFKKNRLLATKSGELSDQQFITWTDYLIRNLSKYNNGQDKKLLPYSFKILQHFFSHFTVCRNKRCSCKIVKHKGDAYKNGYFDLKRFSNEIYSKTSIQLQCGPLMKQILLSQLQERAIQNGKNGKSIVSNLIQLAFFLFLFTNEHMRGYILLMKVQGIKKAKTLRQQVEINVIQMLIERSINSKNQYQQNFYQAIEFADKSKKLRQNLINALDSYLDFYTILTNKIINMKRVIPLIQAIEKKGQVINAMIQDLYTQNPQNSDLVTMLEYYYALNLSSNQSLQQLERQLATDRFRQIINTQVQSRTFVRILDQENIILFLNISDARFGVINKATPNVYNLLGYNEGEIINMNVKQLMPLSFAKHHDNYMRQYLQNGYLNSESNSFKVHGITKKRMLLLLDLWVRIEACVDGVFIAGMLREVEFSPPTFLIDDQGLLNYYNVEMEQTLKMGSLSKIRGLPIAVLLPRLVLFYLFKEEGLVKFFVGIFIKADRFLGSDETRYILKDHTTYLFLPNRESNEEFQIAYQKLRNIFNTAKAQQKTTTNDNNTFNPEQQIQTELLDQIIYLYTLVIKSIDEEQQSDQITLFKVKLDFLKYPKRAEDVKCKFIEINYSSQVQKVEPKRKFFEVMRDFFEMIKNFFESNKINTVEEMKQIVEEMYEQVMEELILDPLSKMEEADQMNKNLLVINQSQQEELAKQGGGGDPKVVSPNMLSVKNDKALSQVQKLIKGMDQEEERILSKIINSRRASRIIGEKLDDPTSRQLSPGGAVRVDGETCSINQKQTGSRQNIDDFNSDKISSTQQLNSNQHQPSISSVQTDIGMNPVAVNQENRTNNELQNSQLKIELEYEENKEGVPIGQGDVDNFFENHISSDDNDDESISESQNSENDENKGKNSMNPNSRNNELKNQELYQKKTRIQQDNNDDDDDDDGDDDDDDDDDKYGRNKNISVNFNEKIRNFKKSKKRNITDSESENSNNSSNNDANQGYQNDGKFIKQQNEVTDDEEENSSNTSDNDIKIYNNKGNQNKFAAIASKLGGNKPMSKLQNGGAKSVINNFQGTRAQSKSKISLWNQFSTGFSAIQGIQTLNKKRVDKSRAMTLTPKQNESQAQNFIGFFKGMKSNNLSKDDQKEAQKMKINKLGNLISKLTTKSQQNPSNPLLGNLLQKKVNPKEAISPAFIISAFQQKKKEDSNKIVTPATDQTNKLQNMVQKLFQKSETVGGRIGVGENNNNNQFNRISTFFSQLNKHDDQEEEHDVHDVEAKTNLTLSSNRIAKTLALTHFKKNLPTQHEEKKETAKDWKAQRDQELQNLEIGSQQSAASSVAATTSLFRSMLMDRSRPYFITKICQVGLLKFWLLILFILLQFLFSNSQLDQWMNYVKHSELPNTLTTSYSIFSSIIEQKILIQELISAESYKVDLIPKIERDHTFLMNLAQIAYQNSIQNSFVNFNFGSLSNKINYEAEKFRIITQFNQSFQETLINFGYGITSLEYFMKDTDLLVKSNQQVDKHQSPIVYLRNNFAQYITTLNKISDILVQEIRNSNTQKDLIEKITILLIVAIVSSIIFAVIAIFLYQKVRSVKHRGQKLLATIPSDYIETKKEDFLLIQMKFKYEFDELNGKKKNHKQVHKLRGKKQVDKGRTNRQIIDTKANLIQYLGSISIIACITIIFHSTFLARMESQLDQIFPLLEELSFVMNSKSSHDTMNSIFYQTLNLHTENQQSIEKFLQERQQTISKSLQDESRLRNYFATLSFQPFKSKVSSKEYESFLKVLKVGDTCTLLNYQGNPILLNHTFSDQQLTECQNNLQQVSRLGIIGTVNKTLSLINQYISEAQQTTFSKDSIKQILDDPSFPQLNQNFVYLNSLFSNYFYMCQQNLQKVLDNQKQELFIFLLSGLIGSFLLFCFAWSLYISKLVEEFSVIKLLYSTLPFDLILTNSYITKFLKDFAK